MQGRFSVKAVVMVAVCAVLCGGVVTSAGAQGTSGSSANSLLPKTGKCDKKLDTIHVSQQATWESPEISNIVTVYGLEAAIEAFNKKYGGVGGHCLELTTCDEAGDPIKAEQCARSITGDSSIVATLNDVFVAPNWDANSPTYRDAGLPRIGLSPGIADLTANNVYAVTGGGVGAVIMNPLPVLKAGAKKLYLVGLDNPQLASVPALTGPLVKANGGEWVGVSRVPAGTTDYQQFVLAAEDAGADAIVFALGEAETTQVIKAAEQLDSDLLLGSSLTYFNTDAVKALGEGADKVYFSADLPPVDGDQKRWPLLKNITADLSASGRKELKPHSIPNGAARSWLATYFFKKIMEEYGDPDNVTRASVTAAFNTAQDVDSGGLIPAWTPNVGEPLLAFTRLSNPWYYQVDWNGKKFVVDEEMANLVSEYQGQKGYAQPTG